MNVGYYVRCQATESVKLHDAKTWYFERHEEKAINRMTGHRYAENTDLQEHRQQSPSIHRATQ